MTQRELEHVTTTGVFGDQTRAEQAISRLQANGYRRNDITVVADQPDPTEQGSVSGSAVTEAPRGLALGLIIGAVIGAVLGFVVSQLLADVELVQFLGPWAMALLGAAAGAALGILAGSMSGLSITKQEAKGLAHNVEAGQWLVSLRSSDPHRAATDLRSAGAMDVREQTAEPEAFKREA